jgi:hypothetical protein
MTNEVVSNAAVVATGKKKRNRKKKPKNKQVEQDDDDDDESTNNPSNNNQKKQQQQKQQRLEEDKMNPHFLLRSKLLSNGFSSDKIDVAMEEMWDQQLAYDEYDAVLQFLQSEHNHENGIASPSSNTTKVSATLSENHSHNYNYDYNGNGNNDHTGSGVEESKQMENSDQHLDAGELPVDAAAVAAAAPVKPAAMTMADKLDMVANSENLTDAAFALSEWISKVAKPHEVCMCN